MRAAIKHSGIHKRIFPILAIKMQYLTFGHGMIEKSEGAIVVCWNLSKVARLMTQSHQRALPKVATSGGHHPAFEAICSVLQSELKTEPSSPAPDVLSVAAAHPS